MKKVLRLLIAAFALVLFAVAADQLSGFFLGTGGLPPADDVLVIEDALGEAVAPHAESILSVGTGFGVLLLGAWLCGKAAAQMGLSKITGFIAFGILLGPGVLGVISKEQLIDLKLINGLAISLIALTAGSEIKLGFLKKSLKQLAAIGIIEMSIVMVLITILMETMFHLDDSPIVQFGGEGAAFWVALTIGCIAAANSPAVVIAIITETGANGLVSKLGLATTVLKDLLTIIAFAIVLALAANGIQRGAEARATYVADHPEYVQEHPEEAELAHLEDYVDGEAGAEDATTGEDDGTAEKESVVWYLIKHVPGSMAAGVMVAFVMAFYVIRVRAHLPIVLVAAGFAIALISQALGLEPLIVGLTAGFLMANLYEEQTHEMFETVEELSMPVYAVFFSVAGCKVEPLLLAEVWHYVLALVFLRAFGTWLGCLIGGKITGVPNPSRAWVWASLIPQAGIAVALTEKIQLEFVEWPFQQKVYTIMLSAVAIHELFGPLLFKYALQRAGEIGGDDGEGSLDEDRPSEHISEVLDPSEPNTTAERDT